MEGPCAESEEKHEPASDADAAVVDSLKALDLNWPIREADISPSPPDVFRLMSRTEPGRASL
jgi:hypothetical protein